MAAIPNHQQHSTGSGGVSHTEAAIARLREELVVAADAADAACAGAGANSRACMVANDIVEEISCALARKKERLAEEMGVVSTGPDPFGPHNPFARGNGGGGGQPGSGGGHRAQR